jgi:sarcosine oxidase subunit beta
MAELIHTGATTTPIEPYHIGRFAKEAVIDENAVA